MQNFNDKKEDESTMIKRRDYQLPPKEGSILTHFLTISDVKRSAEFYLRISSIILSVNLTYLLYQIREYWAKVYDADAKNKNGNRSIYHISSGNGFF